MKNVAVLFTFAAFVAALVPAGAASAHDGHSRRDGSRPVVFVQTNQPNGNQVVVYDRADDGRLTRAGAYDTGGDGGAAAAAVSDKLASQGSLAYDAQRSLLFAVNAGSDSLSMFSVVGDRLTLEDVVPSGGGFPASIAVSDSLVYVLNAGGSGILQGFRIGRNKLHPIHDSARSLGLANTDPPFFLTSPGQVGFTPDGRKLIVTTKNSGSTIDVFGVGQDGRLSDSPLANPSATPVPFAFTFDPFGRLVDGEAGASAVTTYTIEPDGSLAGARSLSDNQAALCWITGVRGFYYVANTGSNTLSGYRIGADGQPALVTPTGIVATTEPGPIDLAASSEGNFGSRLRKPSVAGRGRLRAGPSLVRGDRHAGGDPARGSR